MSKVVLEDVTSLNSLSVLNANFDKLETELNDKVLYRDVAVGEPNSMQDDLDMNGKRVYNLPKPSVESEAVRLKDLNDAILGDYVIETGVSSFNTRGGDVVLTQSDVVAALGYVPVISAVTSFNGQQGAVTLDSADVTTALGFTPISSISPNFSGTPTAPTPTAGDSSTKLATTSFVTDAVTTATTGVISFKGRTGVVVPATNDYLVAQVLGAAPLDSPALTGTPTAPTQLSADNSTKIATTAFVAAKIASSTAGVTSFNTRTGAVSLSSADTIQSLTSTPAEKAFIWNSDIAGASNASTSNNSIYIQRNATYGAGSSGDTGTPKGAIYVHSFTPENAHNSYEWGITSEMFSRSTGHTDTITPANGVAPQNVAINGTVWREGSAPGWGGNFASHNRYNYLNYPSYGTIGIECNVGGYGTDPDADPGRTTIGLHIAAQVPPPRAWSGSVASPLAYKEYKQGQVISPTTDNGYAYVNHGVAGNAGFTEPSWPLVLGATVVDGSITWTCVARSASLYSGIVISGGGATLQYGSRVLDGAGTTASYYSKTSGTFAALFEGSYSTGIHLGNATHSSGNAIVIKANDAIALEGTGTIKVKYDGAGKIQFYNGATKRGYIDVFTGADVSFNSTGGAAGVTSFNGLTGAVTLTSSHVTSALGYTPPSLSAVNTFTGSYNQFNNILYATGGVNVGSAPYYSSSGGGNVDFNSEGSRTFAFWHRMVIDGVTYKFKVYNN